MSMVEANGRVDVNLVASAGVRDIPVEKVNAEIGSRLENESFFEVALVVNTFTTSDLGTTFSPMGCFCRL